MYDNIKLFTQALGLEIPWKLDEVKFHPEQGQLDINISYNARRQFPCPSCQSESSVFDTMERTWRHLNFFQFKAYISTAGFLELAVHHVESSRLMFHGHGLILDLQCFLRPLL